LRAGVCYDIMADYGPKTPLRPPITPLVRKKRFFSGFGSPNYALLTPLFPPKPPENHPFCAHFRAPLFGQNALTLPLVTRHCPVFSF